MTKEKINAIGDFNYLWGLSIAMAKAVGFSDDEIDDIGSLFIKVEDCLLEDCLLDEQKNNENPVF